MILQILDIIAPVFILSGVGWLWAKRDLPYDIAFVTRLGIGVSMPCLIFSTLVRAQIEPSAFQDMMLAALLLYGLFAVVFGAAFRLAGLSLRTFLPPTVMNNTGNLGLPVALYAYGDEGLALAIVLFAIMVTIQFSLGLWFVAGPQKGWDAARQPMVWAAVLGVAGAWADVKLPVFVDATIALTGQMAIPLMVLTLGVSISRIRVGSIKRALVVALMRYVGALAIALGLGAAMGLTGTVYAVLVLQAIMPAPVTNYLLALQYDAEPTEVAGLVVVSTALSIALVPLTLAFLI
ncbi:AEC family transporter [Pikeienuella sp. HZG-20]|uniref:AEC family transporter n=1 Tax=Paludibacillus litoralis TaxID=3133267 RepID=UPI0030EC41C6